MAVPGDGLSVILWDACTGGVHDSEGVLRFGVTLLSSLAVPGDGFGVILRDAVAGEVHDSEGDVPGLRLWNASLGEGAQVGEFLCCRGVTKHAVPGSRLLRDG